MARGGRKPRCMIDPCHVIVHCLRDHQNCAVQPIRVQSLLQAHRCCGRSVSSVDQYMPDSKPADRILRFPVILIRAQFITGRSERHRRRPAKAGKILLPRADLHQISPDHTQDPVPGGIQLCSLVEISFTLRDHAIRCCVDHRSRPSGLNIQEIGSGCFLLQFHHLIMICPAGGPPETISQPELPRLC